jgi:hypothetical protein
LYSLPFKVVLLKKKLPSFFLYGTSFSLSLHLQSQQERVPFSPQRLNVYLLARGTSAAILLFCA